MAYFPNGTAGAYLDAQCSSCPLGDRACPVYGIQMLYNYDQHDEGNASLKEAMNMLIDDNGNCQVSAKLYETQDAAHPVLVIPMTNIPEWNK